MAETKSFFGKIRDSIRNRFAKPQADDLDQSLNKWGFHIHNTKTTEKRLSAQRIVYSVINYPLPKKSEPMDKVRIIRRKHDIMNSIIGLTAGPYGGAGSDPRYDRMFEGWQQIYSDGTWMINGLENYYINDLKDSPIEYKSIDINAMIGMSHEVLQMHFWKYGFMVINKCFKDKHISPETIALIQSITPQFGGQAQNIPSRGLGKPPGM
jgi:hypothetical protein